MGARGTLGQHEFAFGICGSVVVEISCVKSLVAGDPSSFNTVVTLSLRRAWPVSLPTS